MNMVLYYHCHSLYTRLQSAFLDPLGLASDATTVRPDTVAGSNVLQTLLFFGDSRAESWHLPSEVNELLVVNRGISDQTSEQVALRYEAHAKPIRPDVLVLEVGINDLKTIPLLPKKRDSIVDRCKHNISRVVSQATEDGSFVIVATIFPLGKLPFTRRLVWSDDVVTAINEVNRHIATLANRDVRVFITSNILADDAGVVHPEYSKDFLHLTLEGYNALNTQLMVLIDEIKE